MGGTFFDDWALWEKFTFVLGCAIATVFVVGWMKLLLANRRVRKYEVRDEEKRIRIQKMRQNGQEIRTTKSGCCGPEPLFGVKALEQGTQVPGIYVERNSLKAALSSTKSSGSFSDVSSAYAGYDVGVGHEASSPGATFTTPSAMHRSDCFASVESDSWVPKAYKPRRSSGLRYSQATQYHADALSALEGRPMSPTIHVPNGHPSSHAQAVYSDSSTNSSADERATSHSSLSGPASRRPVSQPVRTRAKPPLSYETRGMVYSPRRMSSRTSRHSQYAPIQQQPPQINLRPSSSSSSLFMDATPHIPEIICEQTSDYFALPAQEAMPSSLTTPFNTKSNLFSPPHSPSIPESEKETSMSASMHVSEPFLSSTQRVQNEPEEFGVGNTHLSRKSRYSNATFQVLPAGTFGTPVHSDADDNTDNKFSRKESLLERTSKRLSFMSRKSSDRRANTARRSNSQDDSV